MGIIDIPKILSSSILNAVKKIDTEKNKRKIKKIEENKGHKWKIIIVFFELFIRKHD